MIDRAAIYGLGPAAGRQPLTGDAPPALAMIGGRSLLDHALDRLAAQGVGRALLSVHHHRARIAAELERRTGGPRAELLAEPEPLGAAAALAAAARALDGAPFYAVAADQVWFDGFVPALARLARKWDPRRMEALILLHPTTRAIGEAGRGDFFLDPAGLARPRAGTEIAALAACGVGVFDARLFAEPPARDAGLDAILAGAARRRTLFAIVHDGEWCRRPGDEATAALEVAIGYRPVPAAKAESLPPRGRSPVDDCAEFAAMPPRRRPFRFGLLSILR
jgi:MurNAc alpha-1-phosphate uridylyltransferase